MATAIRYAYDTTKTSAWPPKTTPTPQPKKPSTPTPKTPAQDYGTARRQAATPTQEEYQQLLRLGYTGSYSKYAYDKQHSNFPSPTEYMYNKQQGRPNYQTYGPVEVANYQSGATSYRVSHSAASGTPKVESINPKLDYHCGTTSKIAEDNINSSQFEDILKMFAVIGGGILLEAGEKALKAIGDHTYSIGGEYSGAAGVATSFSYGIAIDTKGNIGVFNSESFGGGTPNLGGSGFITITNAPDISYLGGFSQQVGGSILVIGAEAVLFKSNETGKTYSGKTISAGKSAVDIELHGTMAYTTIKQVADLKEPLLKILLKLLEWSEELDEKYG